MKTETKNQGKPVVQQVTNNATSWIGQRKNDIDNIITGQTFIATSEGDLEAIEILPVAVTRPGKMIMTIHNFDEQKKMWGPALATSSNHISYNENGKWLAFNLEGMHLNKGNAYGFKLESPDTFIGVAEAAGSYKKPPVDSGQEWQFTRQHGTGKFFSYFGLAFKVDMKAA